uniref:Pyrin domain-containing protein n=1 Tax=Cyprinus carpio carpio TaxID=630221 RepID=A0A9J8DD13_CYPCA
MGSSASQEDQVPLLKDNEEIQPIFEELKLVLIGSQGAGKNTIANAILKEKAFTFWTSYKSVHIKKTCTVSGTQIHLTRTPGWRGDLSRSEQTKQEIVLFLDLLLALKVNAVLSESNINTLENLLTVQLWKHTIVLFTYGEKLGGYNIEDYIRCQQFQPLIKKCGERYFVIRNNDSNQIIETIQELVARKNSAYYFKLSAQTEVNNTLLSDWRRLVERIKSKIASLSAFKENLLSNPNTQNNHSLKRLLDLKDAEIKRLNDIVEEKEREIERLRSRYSRTQELDLSGLHRRIKELEDQLDTMSSELEGKNTENKILEKQVKEKDAKIEELKTELQMQQQKAIDWRTHDDQNAAVHAGYLSELCQDVSVVAIRSQTQIQLQALPSKALLGWSDTLLKILNELSDEDLEKIKYFLFWNTTKYGICRSSAEHKNRVKLADQMLKQWGEEQSVLNTRDLVKNIPRNDDAMRELFEPYLKSIGETW